jgi:hypothetical protein
MRNMIFPYLMREVFEKKGTFYFRLKKKKNLDKSDMSINHPNTPFTFDENNNFVGH